MGLLLHIFNCLSSKVLSTLQPLGWKRNHNIKKSLIHPQKVSLPVFSKFVCNKLVEGDHPERLIDRHSDVLVGAFNDLLKNFASSLSREQMLTSERMHLDE